MAGIKRKQTEAPAAIKASGDKKIKTAKKASAAKPVKEARKPSKKHAKPAEPESEEEDLVESDTTESDNGFAGFSAKEGDGDVSMASGSDSDVEMEDSGAAKKGSNAAKAVTESGSNGNSREAHQKQKQLAKERKMNKPLGDELHRSKKIWERLRLKSHVPKDERKKLVAELFDIITGRVKEFVFKHDSTRVIQCALKYSTPEQRKMIAHELKGEYKALAESRYAKFLVGKILVDGDTETREMIISEFYGSVKRLINHPEASWIVDDIYRGMATKAQKARILREWYGAEFAVFKAGKNEDVTADLSEILQESPEKRRPIMDYCRIMINSLIQKKMTGFTMLHDAMLQYFLATKPGSEEATDFLELLKGDEEGDLLKNLAFTKNGARVVCLALAYGTAKDRKNLLRMYKENIEIMAFDAHAHQVLMTALDVVDDTVLTTKLIFPELLSTNSSIEVQQEKLLNLANDKIGRITILYPLCSRAKWLFPSPEDLALLDEVHSIRSTTSKKDSEIRRKEVVKAYSATMLNVIAADPSALAQSSFGCQFITEALLGASADDKAAAVEAVAALAAGDPNAEDHLAQTPHAGRMFKTLATGGHFDPKTKTTTLADPPLGFGDALYDQTKDHLVEWATGAGSFVVVALVEAEGFGKKEKVLKALKKEKAKLEKAANGDDKKKEKKEEKKKKGEDKKDKKKEASAKKPSGNPGSRILLEKL
ncbi:pumilio domain-containing protein [Diplodia corticola]|uniref:Pumilio domain-containing protein n=1 Tax=Diplodia corticola TaxID=236234 RepID=A0A1J9R882_9PEZI|nr:pumilio domain-containing protein [Diplodia corticola]OJD37758.1 pumilio domain-containing protein [Diplodia corticola]